MLGKWHLGHQSARYLPTARGFESFTGIVTLLSVPVLFSLLFLLPCATDELFDYSICLNVSTHSDVSVLSSGYLDGDNYYFSKKNPTKPHFHDFLSMDRSCYYTYDNPGK